MRICHFEDARAAGLEPVALSRPAFELRCGFTTLAQKQRRLFRPDATFALVRPYLSDLYARANPTVAVNDPDALGEAPAVLVNARWLPPARPARIDADALAADGPCVALVGDEVAYAVLLPDDLAPLTLGNLPICLEQWRRTLPTVEAGGQLLRHLWDVVDANAEQIEVDFQATRPADPSHRPTNLSLVGPSDWLRVDPTARIDPFVVADTSNGPVVIDRDAVVTSFTRLEGPCYVGPRAQVFAAQLRGGTTVGPNCRVGGEVAASILHGYANKYHEGFLGHSYVGEWVNLAAGTHTSDLRNDYGEVKVMVNGVLTPTGRHKVGCYVGDHAKSGLGSLINTGTNVGAFANLLPSGALLPKFVPSFSWVEHGRVTDRGDLAALFATAERVMERRGEEFGEFHRALFQALHERTALLRRQALYEADLRRLRRAG
jgi:UDP-N-acetylglucosamine diphosphorylase/glucosamine-1-phosphate N-acetyltransferase